MKTFYALLSLLACFMGSNAKADFKTTDAVIADGGEVIIYFLDGNDTDGYYVVVRNCGKDYPRVEKRSDCKAVGPENRVQEDMFKNVLKISFLTGDPEKLKPLTADEVKANRTADPKLYETLKRQESKLAAERARILAYIKLNGPEEKALAQLAEVEHTLVDVRARLEVAKSNVAVVRKVDRFLSDLVRNQIGNARKLNRASAFQDGDKAIFTLLRQFDGSKGECGTDELVKPTTPRTVDDRVRNCSLLPGSMKKVPTKDGDIRWDLVLRARDARTGKYNEIWRDSKTALVWGDVLASNYSHTKAIEFNDNGSVANEVACTSDEGKLANGQITEKAFGLPSIEEYLQAQKDGVLAVVPNMGDRLFWSSSLTSNRRDYARVFSGVNGVVTDDMGSDLQDSENSIRCVGR